MKTIASLGVSATLTLTSHAAVIQFNLIGSGGAGLLPSNQVPVATSSGAGNESGAGINYDTDTNQLTIAVSWTGLTGDVTASHLHGLADQNSNAGVLANLPRMNSTANGSINTTITLSEANEQGLLAGMTYINIHTSANPAGELRANLVQVPEPSTVLLLGLSSFSLIRRRR